MLEVKDLSKSYLNKTVLRDISFSLDKDAGMLVTGTNGAGKTTLLQILANCLIADKGEVLYHDKNWKNNLGWVPSSSESFFPEINGIENLKIFASMKGFPNEESDTFIRKLLQKKEFHFLREPFLTYSSGMKNKLNFLRGIIHKPNIVILDEPLEHIDHSGQTILTNMLLELKAGVIIATHQVEYWKKYTSNQLVLQENGEFNII